MCLVLVLLASRPHRTLCRLGNLTEPSSTSYFCLCCSFESFMLSFSGPCGLHSPLWQCYQAGEPQNYGPVFRILFLDTSTYLPTEELST